MRVLSALILSVALALPLPALAESAATPTISVTGMATVETVPDLATLTIGVTTLADTAAAALTANSVSVQAVMERLAAAGIEPRDMQTSNLSLNPNWTGYDTGNPVISGYQASYMLTIRVRDLAGLGAVLDAAVADGANTLNGLSFGLADPGPTLDEARKKAVADARARADLLAAAAGVSLGRILSISDSATATNDPGPVYKAEMASVPVAGGEVGLSATVTILYEIVQ